MFARLSAFVIWSLVAATAVFWALRFGVRAPQAPAHAVPIDRAVLPRGDLARLFGAPPVLAVAQEGPAPEAPSRFRLVGVMAPKSSTPEGTGAYGLALIAIDGKPAKAFAVGARLDSDLVLQSVGLRTASLGSAQGARSVLLELPALPPPATGVLPAPGAPAAPAPAAIGAVMRPNANPVPAMAAGMASPQPPAMQAPAMQAPPVPVPVPGSANQLPPNPNLPSPDNFRSQ